jgi:hypothetical protein
VNLSRAVAATAVSALLALTGCASSEPLVADGVGSGSANEAVTTGGAPQLTEQNFLSGVSDAQLEARSARLDMSIQLQGQSVTATGAMLAEQTLEDSAMQVEMEIPGLGTMEMILVDGVAYLNLGQLTADKYARLRLDDPAAKEMLGQLKGSLSPAELTRALEGAVTDFEEVGTDTVDGEETTKYVLEVDARKVLATQGMGQLPPGVELPKAFTYTFWINDQNLPLRVTAEMGSAGELEMRFSNWGEPVDIQAPAPEDITDESPFALPQV